jgi:hypothetical protein
MEDKYNGYVKELIKTLTQIEILIEDNNQNIKDCLSIIKEINKIIVPKPKSNFFTVFSKLFGGKSKIM